MCTPTAQDYFSSSRVDDLGIGPADRLLRHCRPPVQVVPCKLQGQKLSDQIFRKKPSDVGVSVDLECLLHKEGRTWEDRFGAMPNTQAMVAVAAAEVRRAKGGAAWTPKPAEPDLAPQEAAKPNPYHAEIIGDISRADGRALSRNATVLKSLI